MKSVIKNAAFAAGVSILIVAGAHAGTAGEPQRIVHFGDLDISMQDGASVLLSRLGHAADEVCGRMPSMHEPDHRARYRTCVRKALDDAVAQVASPVVSALYAGKTNAQVASDR